MMMNSIAKIDLNNSKKYGRVYGTYEGSQPVLIVSDPQLIKMFYKTEFYSFNDQIEVCSPKALEMQAIQALRGNDWRKVRPIIDRSLSASRIREMINEIDLRPLITFLRSTVGKKISPGKVFSIHIFDQLTRVMFGFDLDLNNNKLKCEEIISAANYVFWVLNFLNVSYTKYWLMNRLPFWLSQMLGLSKQTDAASEIFRSMMSHVLQERMRSGCERNDVLQTLVNAIRAGSLTESGAIANAVVALATPVFATAAALSFVPYQLGKNPDHQKKVQQEIDSVLSSPQQQLSYDDLAKFPYLDAVISETLRINTPDVRGWRRVSSTAGAKIPGTDIHLPHGTGIQVPYYVLHRDPDYWTEPMKFNPERFLPENKVTTCSFMAFGSGPRMCPGARLAVNIMKIVMINILREFSVTEAIPDHLELPRDSLRGHPGDSIKVVLQERFATAEN